MGKCNVTCCIKGCSNIQKSGAKVHFYSFPRKSLYVPWRMEKRNLWIQAVKSHVKWGVNEKNSPWEPSANTRICSAHFVNRVKAEHPLHPAYVPTIFPEQKVRKIQSTARFERHIRRTLKNQEIGEKRKTSTIVQQKTDGLLTQMEQEARNIEVDDVSETHRMPMVESLNTPLKCSIECQTDILDVREEVELNYFFCALKTENGCSTAETQVNLQFPHAKTTSVLHGKKKTEEVACSASLSDAPECIGFHGYQSVTSEEEIHDLSGVTLFIFNLLLNLLPDIRSSRLSKQNKLLLFLMKLRLGLSFTTLGVLFSVHRTTASRIFEMILQCLAKSLSTYIYWPKKANVRYHLPQAFKERYKNCRVIIDCTEFKIETPSTVEQRVLAWSEYKHAHTLKVLIGCTPCGFISFKSKCYGGRSGDSFITNDCGILDLLEPNDVVLADKGFPHIQTGVENKKAIFVMPPFLRKEQFSPEEVTETYSIASVRIHIERCIQRIKLFLILRLIPVELLPYADAVVTVICALVNLGSPLINMKEK